MPQTRGAFSASSRLPADGLDRAIERPSDHAAGAAIGSRRQEVPKAALSRAIADLKDKRWPFRSQAPRSL
jgi:hypothetical protein